ncbi:MAG: hypothetical protein KDI79_04340 [Anaerolineae bacterium]|nr:hypothetical protein [Anaerolineae bacterium]
MSEPGGLLAFLVVSLAFPIGWSQLRPTESESSSGLYPLTGIVRFLYFAGIPYLAVLLGLLTLEQLGLTGLVYFNLIDWQANLFLEFQQAATLLLLSWLLDSGRAIVAGGAALVLLWAFRWGLGQAGVRWPPRDLSVVDIVCLALHWAFYRAIFWAVTGDLYLGVVLGSAAVIFEWILLFKIKTQPFPAQTLLLDAVILILTGTVFFYSPNLWLLLPFHWGLAALMAWPGYQLSHSG